MHICTLKRVLHVGLIVFLLHLFSSSSSAQMRTWTDATGKHKVEAKFEKMDGAVVVLLKENGRNARLPLEKLSETDRDFVKTLLAKKDAAEKPKTNAAKKDPPSAKAESATNANSPEPKKSEPASNKAPPKKGNLNVAQPEKLVRPVIALEQSHIDELPDELKDGAATLFKGSDFPAMRATLDSLKENWPDGNNETLLKLLQRTSTSQGKFCRLSATELLIKHDAKNSLPFIVLQVEDSSQDVRWQTLDFIEETLPPEALPLLVEIFTGPEQSKVSRIMTKYGTVVEPFIHKYLTSRNAILRMEACSLLANVGTNKSIKLLEKIENFDSNASVSLQAKSAIRKIKKRESAKAEKS